MPGCSDQGADLLSLAPSREAWATSRRVFGNVGLHPPTGRAPGFWNADISLTKEVHLTESKYFQFRWDVFNALNHQNLGIPDNTWCLPPNPDGSTDAIHIFGCQFGRITNVQTDPRAMQFAMKFFF